MASTTRKDDPEEGVEFIHEDDGRITARDTETGVAFSGKPREALRMLAEALELHEEGGEPVDDTVLREFGLDSDDDADDTMPEFMPSAVWSGRRSPIKD